MSLAFELYREVLDNLHEGMYLINEKRTIIFWNNAAERVTGYLVPEVVGRKCRHHLFRHTNFKGKCLCSHACPIERTFTDLRPREIDVYAHHKDGSRVLTRLQISPFKDPSGETVVAVKFDTDPDSASFRKRFYEDHVKKEPHQETLPLVAERRAIERQLTADLDELRRYGWSFGIMFISVDRFDTIVSQYGSAYGYKALRMIAETLTRNLRTSDIVGRWGENQFVVIALNVDSRGLKALADRLRVLVAQSRLTCYKEQISFTVSIGVSAALPEDTMPELVERSSILLRKSCSAGGNMVTI
ncbi:MAG TPA: sensor domain-containing diguanylate cyclase [Geobacteraceae bacterium]